MYYFFAFLLCRKRTLHSYAEGDFKQNFLYLTRGCLSAGNFLFHLFAETKTLDFC